MRTKNNLILVLMIIGILAVCQSAVVLGSPIPGQAVLKMTQNGKPDDVLHGSGARVRDSIPGSQTFLIEIESGDNWETIIDELEADTLVLFVEPNYSVELPESYQMSISFPDDDRPLLDGVEPVEFFKQPSIYSVGIESAHEIATGEGTTVAIIDNGVDFDHPYLFPRLLTTGYDFISDDNDPSYEIGEFSSHGTFVTGLIALMAPDCQILPLRAFDGDGNGNTYAIAEAIYYATGQGVDVINMSFGTVELSSIVVQAANQAILNGVSMVAASGNNSLDIPIYPASLPGVIAVSGIDTKDLIASFSNYGDYIDVCAPAVDLYSTLTGEDDWGTWSGTSFAAPFVTAACLLVKQLYPDYSTFIMQEHIRQTASTEFLWGTLIPPDPYYGYGRINVYNAVTQTDQAEMVEMGDLDGDGRVSASDVFLLVNHVCNRETVQYSHGNPDVNCDGVVDAFDIEYFINRVYYHGPRSGRCK